MNAVSVSEKRTVKWARAIPASIIFGAILGLALYQNFSCLKAVDVIYYKTGGAKNFSVSSALIYIFCAVAALTSLYLPADEKFTLTLNKALCPLLLLLPFLFLPFKLYTPVIFVFIIALCVMRVGSVFRPETASAWERGHLVNLIIISFFAAGWIYWCTFIQLRDYNSLYLSHDDWGFYLDIVNNTLNGKPFYTNSYMTNSLGIHFRPGAILLLAPYVWCFRSITAFFILSPLILYCASLLIYGLAIKNGLSKGTALAMGLFLFFHPSLSNMIIAIFYGFHPIYLMLPVIALFLFLYDSKKYFWAFAVFILSLTIKESVPVFWAGIGIVFLLKKRIRSGLFILLFSVAYFIVAVKILMPAFSDSGEYIHLVRYGRMGKSFTDLLLAPFRYPDTFINVILKTPNFYFLILLFLPVSMVVFNVPVWLIATVPMLFFICLQDSRELVNIQMHYQTEALALLLASTVYSIKKIKSKTHCAWNSILLWGIKEQSDRRSRLDAAVLSVCISCVLCFYFFGISGIGKNFFNTHINSTQLEKLIDTVKTQVPPGKDVSATPRIGAHFLLRNQVYPCKKASDIPREYVVMDLTDMLTYNKDFETFRYKLLNSKKYKDAGCLAINNHFIVFLQKTDTAQVPQRKALKNIPDGKWRQTGIPLKNSCPEIDIRIELVKDGKEKTGKLYFRVMEKIDYDVSFRIYIEYEEKGQKISFNQIFAFGNGFTPAYTAERGDVYTVSLPMPSVENVYINIETIKKTPPDFSEQPF